MPPDKPSLRSTPIRVLLIAPSLDILGGQAVQATRIREEMAKEPGVRMSFLPINPRLPGKLAKLQQIRYLRTAITFSLYFSRLIFRAPAADILHIFSASYYSCLFWSTPEIGR